MNVALQVTQHLISLLVSREGDDDPQHEGGEGDCRHAERHLLRTLRGDRNVGLSRWRRGRDHCSGGRVMRGKG